MPKLPEEPFDPKLRQAMEEIKDVIKKYDVAAAIVLQTPNHAEHYLEVSPSWSCMTIQGNQVRFKAAMKTGDAAEKERGRASISMIMGFIDTSVELLENFKKLAMIVGKKVGIEHISKYTPRDENL